jgi:hypothetical protein
LRPIGAAYARTDPTTQLTMEYRKTAARVTYMRSGRSKRLETLSKISVIPGRPSTVPKQKSGQRGDPHLRSVQPCRSLGYVGRRWGLQLWSHRLRNMDGCPDMRILLYSTRSPRHSGYKGCREMGIRPDRNKKQQN